MLSSEMFHINLVDMLRDLNSIKRKSIMIVPQKITRHYYKNLKLVVISYKIANRNWGDNQCDPFYHVK
jgi:hypothetical protein